jgi:hypothetical protein
MAKRQCSESPPRPPYGIHWPALRTPSVRTRPSIARQRAFVNGVATTFSCRPCRAPPSNSWRAGESLLKQLTFDRVVGVVYIHGRGTLNDLMVQAGAAAPKKQR